MSLTPTVVAKPERLLSLDVLRGITIAAMILVNDPGSWEHVFPPLDHAEWNGATPTDMIFPSFLVMVGISMTLSFATRLERGASHRHLALHAIRRGALLVFLGLLLNAAPQFEFAQLRFPGVLQRIGICYTLAALLFLALPGPESGRWRRQREIVLAAVAVALLGGYWLLLRFYPTPGFGAGRLDSYGSLPAFVDRAVFGLDHIYRYGTTPGFGITYDPEGLLSTLPALATLLIGVLAGEEMRRERCAGWAPAKTCGTLALAGAALWLAGLALSLFLPLNKKLWTSSFAIFSAGIALLLLAGCFYLVDLRQSRRGLTLPLIFGTNAILCYVLADALAITLGQIHVLSAGRPVRLSGLLYRSLFARLLPPRVASVSYAAGFVLVIAGMVYPLYRRRIFLRL